MKIKKLPEKLINLGIVAVLVVTMYLLKISCLIKAVFHFPCPGCGMTRAYISLLKLDFAAAFQYHPMFWAVPILGLMYLFDGKLFRQNWLNNLIIYGIVAGLIVTWVIRLILGDPVILS